MSGATTTGASAATAEPLGESRKLPAITAGTSQEYMQELVELTARAFASQPLTICFTRERFGIDKVTPALIATAHVARISSKISLGAEIVEAGHWAAAACWEPPGMATAPSSNRAQLRETRPIYCGFIDHIEAVKRKYLKGKPHWHLSLMARDPDRQVKGAVRAVLEPYLARAKAEGVPIWIEAGSARARDVYLYFGFQVVEDMVTGKGVVGSDGYPLPGGPGVVTWLMTYGVTD